jgi:hypothetical protein
MASARRFHVFSTVLAVGLFAACATDATGPSPNIEIGSGAGTNDSMPEGPAPAFLVCAAQPYAADSAWIGPNGGEIKLGKTEFKVPRGALHELTLITMELPSDTIKSVRFSPEGLTFNPVALPELKLDYKGCPKQSNKGKGNAGDKVKVVYVTEQLEVINALTSLDDDLTETVQTNLKHFSRYAITY